MESPLSKRRALILSVFATGAVNVLKFYPKSAAVMDSVEAFVAHRLAIPPEYDWTAKVVLFVITTLLVYAIIKSPVGVWIYNSAATVVRLALARIGKRRMVFAPEDRNTWEFRADVLFSSKHSTKMYCLLVSAYTIVHEEERFMLGDWLKGRDLRVLLLARESVLWNERARLFIDKRLYLAGRDAAHYKAECEIAELELKNGFRAQVGFYDDGARWRLYIFDDRVFASRYTGPPEADFGEARDGPVVAFPHDHPMYHWLYSEFYRLAPEEWKRSMAKPQV
jgi:hypothetical protein